MGNILSISQNPPNNNNKFPISVDLRSFCPPVYSQGQLGTCTAHALTGLYGTLCNINNSDPNFLPSRLFLYFNEQIISGNPGVHIHDGIASLKQNGVCSEYLWPYLEDAVKIKPPEDCYNLAKRHRVISAQNVNQNLNEIKKLLIQQIPFAFGFNVYDNFHESDFVTGIMKMPTASSKIIGYHAIMCAGYNDDCQSLLCRNSWGSDWGMDGYFWMPYEFVLNPKHCHEFWQIDNFINSGVQ